MTKQYVIVGEVSYPIDTLEQIAVAESAMVEAEVDQVYVYAGSPDCPDSYVTQQVLVASGGVAS